MGNFTDFFKEKILREGLPEPKSMDFFYEANICFKIMSINNDHAVVQMSTADKEGNDIYTFDTISVAADDVVTLEGLEVRHRIELTTV